MLGLPLVTARDNLALAKTLAKTKDYNGAYFALGHAKDALKEYQQTAGKNESARAEKLQTQIASLQVEITDDTSVSVGADIENHIKAWMHDVENLKSKM